MGSPVGVRQEAINVWSGTTAGKLIGPECAMSYPAASRGVSSSILARHSVRDTPAPYWIRGLPRTGYGKFSRALLDTGFRRYDELATSRGE